MSKQNLEVEMIIGLDVINECELKITPEETTLKKWKKKDQSTQKRQIEENDMETTIEEFRNINFITTKEQNEPDLSHITDKSIRNKIQNLIENYHPTEENECPIEMNIILRDETPITVKPRRLSPSELEEAEKMVNEWKKDKVIQESLSPFAAQIVLVPKKDNTKRMCVDFRPLNKRIIRDRFPIPNMEEQLDKLQRGTIFTTLDLKNAYFHVPVNDRSRKYTAFVVPSGQYEFTRVPFGLSNSPSIFCRFINIIFRKLITEGIVTTYMDDIIIISNTEEEAIRHLEIVLKLAASFNLQIKWKNANFSNGTSSIWEVKLKINKFDQRFRRQKM